MRAHEDLSFISDGDLSLMIESKARDVYYILGFSFHLSWTGSPEGIFKLQWNNVTTDPWRDVKESIYQVTTTQNSLMYNVKDVYFKYVRIVWVPIYGSGILRCKYIGKGYG